MNICGGDQNGANYIGVVDLFRALGRDGDSNSGRACCLSSKDQLLESPNGD